jgi:hypothetical protein
VVIFFAGGYYMKIRRFISAVLAATMAFSVLGVTASADFTTEDGKTYYIVDGEVEKGFEKIDGNYYYFKQADGAMAKGWLKISGNWYYFSTKDGKMFQGKTYKIGGDTYTFAADGKVTNYKSAGISKGKWGESLKSLKARLGENFEEEVNDSGVNGGIDYTPYWTKIDSKTSVGAGSLYYFEDDLLYSAALVYICSENTADIKEIKRVGDSAEITDKQIAAVYKIKTAEAERKCGTALTNKEFDLTEENLAFDPNGYTECKVYMSDNIIIAVMYDKDAVIYLEISIDTAAKIAGITPEEFITMFTEYRI